MLRYCVVTALIAVAIIAAAGALFTYRIANTSGIVVAQFLQPTIATN